MDPITLIVAALTAGASTGAIDALKDNVKDAAKAAYGKLHDLVKRRLAGNSSAEVILAEHQADPEIYAVPLAKKLTEAGASQGWEAPRGPGGRPGRQVQRDDQGFQGSVRRGRRAPGQPLRRVTRRPRRGRQGRIPAENLIRAV